MFQPGDRVTLAINGHEIGAVVVRAAPDGTTITLGGDNDPVPFLPFAMMTVMRDRKGVYRSMAGDTEVRIRPR